jgi:hypothetical protein
MDFVQRTETSLASRLAAALAEYRFVLLVTLGLLIFTTIPTIFGYLSTPPDKWFSGVVYNVHDTAQYFSWMRESGDKLFIENKLTSEPNEPIFLNLHWWIPGRFAALTGLSIFQVYQIYRLASIPLLTFTIYAFLVLVFKDVARRRFAFLLTIFTSGLGWIWVVAKQFTGELLYPTDVYTTPGNTFYVMMVSPPQAFATALTLLVILVAVAAVWRGSIWLALGAGLLAAFLGTGHIYDLVTVWAVLAVYGLLLTLRDGWSWKRFWLLFSVVLLSAPTAAYWGWVSSDANPLWQQALSQYDNLGVFTPDPVHLIILLGLTFIVGLLGYTGIVPLKEQTNQELLIKGWFGITLLLIYLPFHFRIMLLTGYQLPLAVMATWVLYDRFFPWLRERMDGWKFGRGLNVHRLGAVFFLLAVLPTNLYLFSWRIYELSKASYPYYLERSEVATFQWLENNASPDSVVLSSFTIGHYLPGMTGTRGFLTNAVMTMDFNNKYELVEKFYHSEWTDKEREAFLRKYDIDYVFYGPSEKRIGSYNPEESELFRKVFEMDDVAVYEVIFARYKAGPILHALLLDTIEQAV